MPRTTLLPAVLLASALALPATAQTVVSGGGDRLQQAVDAASPGDVLVVRAAQYSRTRVSKGLTILCDPGVVILNVFVIGEALILDSIPAGQRLYLKGGETGRSSITPSATHVHDCAGTVVLEGLKTDVLDVARGAQVAVTGAEIALDARVEDSTVSFSLCTVGPGSSGNCSDPFCGALTVVSSDVEIANVVLRGAPGFFTLTPGAALRLDGGRVRITGSASALIAGSPSALPPPAPAIHAPSGRIEIDPRVVLQSAAIPAIQGSATVVQRPIPSVRAEGAGTGTTWNVLTESVFGTTFATVLNPVTAVTPTPFGDLWLGLPAYLLDSGTMNAAGQRGVRITVSAAAFAQAWTFQAAALSTSGELVIGPPTVVVFR